MINISCCRLSLANPGASVQIAPERSMSILMRRWLAVWFGFFGSFLVGVFWKFLPGAGQDRLVGLGMTLYGVCFLLFLPATARPRWVRAYGVLMSGGAALVSGRLLQVALNRPTAYRHWSDWLLLVFLMVGMWSLPVVTWMVQRRRGLTSQTPCIGQTPARR